MSHPPGQHVHGATLTGDEITCRELIEFLMDYLDGRVEPERARVFDAHMSVCRSCRNYLETYKRTVDMGRVAVGVDEAVAPGSVPQGLVRAILAARRVG